MPRWIRVFTLDEANALLPELVPRLDPLKQAHDRVHAATAHVQDLEIVWGDDVKRSECPDHGEYMARVADLRAKRLALHTELRFFAVHGVQVKDIDQGLLDFHAFNGRDLVYLCWRRGEERIEAWHPLDGGFAARRPLPEFLADGPTP